MDIKIKTYLTFILLFIGILPIGASFFIVDGLFSYQSEMTKKLEMNSMVDDYGKSLRELSLYNSKAERTYKKTFEQLQEKKLLLAEQDGLMGKLSQSLKKVYFIIFGILSMVLFLIGSFLSRRISQAYSKTYVELQEKKERERYLSQFEKISDVIKTINHEMKKPLAPIEVWNQNIRLSFDKKEKNFSETLDFGNKVISEEVRALKNIINSFNTYTSLPEPQFKAENIEDFVNGIAINFNEVYEELSVVVRSSLNEAVLLNIDKKLLSQVFQNLIENAIEANPNEKVEVYIRLFLEKDSVYFDIENAGAEVFDLVQIFEPQVTTKENQGGTGLGLSISKVTLLKHGGDLEALPKVGGAKFRMALPLSKNS